MGRDNEGVTTEDLDGGDEAGVDCPEVSARDVPGAPNPFE